MAKLQAYLDLTNEFLIIAENSIDRGIPALILGWNRCR
jgi:hypothetical protein